MWFTALRALLYMTGFALLWGWPALTVRRFDQDLGVLLPSWTGLLGIILMVLGTTLVMRCAAAFIVKGRGTPASFDPPREFVASGSYRYVRNPMYVGGVVLLTGFGFYHRSISMVVFSFFVWLLIHFFVVLVEEPGLARRFGHTYLSYKKSVPRWLPTM